MVLPSTMSMLWSTQVPWPPLFTASLFWPGVSARVYWAIAPYPSEVTSQTYRWSPKATKYALAAQPPGVQTVGGAGDGVPAGGCAAVGGSGTAVLPPGPGTAGPPDGDWSWPCAATDTPGAAGTGRVDVGRSGDPAGTAGRSPAS